MGIQAKRRLITLGLLWGVPVLAAVLLVPSVTGYFLDTATDPAFIVYATPVHTEPGATVHWPIGICRTDTQARPGPSIRVTAWENSRAVISADPQRLSSLRASECAKAVISFTALRQRAWRTIAVYDGNDRIGELGVSTRASIAPTVDVSVQDGTLNSISGGPASILLTSGTTISNAKTLPVAWRLEGGPWYGSGTAEITPGSRIILADVKGQHSWKRWFWRTWPFTKDERLVLTRAQRWTPQSAAQGCTDAAEEPIPIERVYPVHVGLRGYDATAQDNVTTVLALLPLLSGGLLAYVAHTILPVENDRRRVRYALDNLHGELRELRRLRHTEMPYLDIVYRLHGDVHRFRERLESWVWGSPDLASELPRMTESVQTLTIQVGALRRIAALPRTPGSGIGLIALDMISAARRAVARELRASVPDTARLNTAVAQLEGAEALLRFAGEEPQVVAEALSLRCRELMKTITELANDNGFKALQNDLARDLERVRTDPAAGGEQHAREFAFWRVRIACERLKAGSAAASILQDLHRMQPFAWELLQQARDRDMPPDRLQKALNNLRLVPDRMPVRAGEMVNITAWFRDDEFNYSPIRERSSCVWRFGEGKRVTAGWAVWHYFPMDKAERQPKEHRVTLEEVDTGTAKERVCASVNVMVTPVEKQSLTRPWLTTAGTLLGVQLIPLFGLLASNRDVVRNRDPLGAILILIAAGFATDTGRKLITTVGSALASQAVQITRKAAAPGDVPAGSDLEKEELAKAKS